MIDVGREGVNQADFGEADELLAERIQVLDPHHSLYGRTFHVIRRVARRGGNCPKSNEVGYGNGVRRHDR